MGRRKTLLYGHRLATAFETALGFPESDHAQEVLDSIDYKVPKIDWGLIELAVGLKIPDYSKSKIDLAFEGELGWRVRRKVTSVLSGISPEPETSESEFLKKVANIENIARKLSAEIDGLAEIGTILLTRPKPKDGLTSAEVPTRFYARVTGQTLTPTEDCFFDYLAFRKMLDYFERFTTQNGGFTSVLGNRFARTDDYSWYEQFVRRVVLAFLPTDFPLTVTIPTDTNPEYNSPIILVLEELRAQFNDLALSVVGFSDLHEEWSYRQHARLVLQLRDEFEKNDTFWILAMNRKWDSDQSEFDHTLF